MNATSFQQLIPGQATNFSNLFELSNTSSSVLERLFKLNMQVLKTALAENQVIWETALASKSPQELIALSANTAKASAEKAAIYGRQVQEIFSGAQSEATAAVVSKLERAQRDGQRVADKLSTESTVIIATT
ncbi:TIGR01841 family phasin [Burkholderia sp. PAMC 26561]|uniref:TIGR01841 family phasin n=1 Tax=Burkholderia sp. PAMC 26561 TaxID=1795043 RepID=UPI00076AEEC6|nr:TIGR01841 family phasin [Burkholderia sp. PAMC 26561]AME23732.1 hypothetical protein AXG89_07595 [Burkholderia sp. PAMC 26561]